MYLSFGSRSIDVALGDVAGTDLRAGRRWSAVRLRHSGGRATVSGLARNDARAVVDALEAARVVWWRCTLAAPIGTLGAVHDRLARLADPPAYVTEKVIRDLRREAEAAAGGFVARWPSALSNTPEIRTLCGSAEGIHAGSRCRGDGERFRRVHARLSRAPRSEDRPALWQDELASGLRHSCGTAIHGVAARPERLGSVSDEELLRIQRPERPSGSDARRRWTRCRRANTRA